MCRTFLTVLATALGAVVISVSSLVIYQHLTYVQVVPPAPVITPAPAAPPVLPPDAAEAMEVEPAQPAGRFLPMPKTGSE